MYRCSDAFRINAQKKRLDVWLIYQCCYCDNRWNAEVLQRVNTNSLTQQELYEYHNNKKELINRYAMDAQFLKKLGVEYQLPEYIIKKEQHQFDDDISLIHIINSYSVPYRIKDIVRKGLSLSHTEVNKKIETNQIYTTNQLDLNKARLVKSVKIMIDNDNNI